MLQDSEKFPTPKDGHAYDTGGAGNLVNSPVWGSGSSLAAVIMSRFCTILYAEVRVDFASKCQKRLHALMYSHSSTWVSSMYTPCS